MVTSSSKKALLTPPFYENNKMQQKKQQVSHSAHKMSTPSHGPNKTHPQCQSSSSKKKPAAKKSLHFGTPKTKMGHAHSLPATPISIPKPLFPQQNSFNSRGSLTPSPKSNLYAGSKCYEPPTPESLPRPPTAWTGSKRPINMQALVSSMQMEEQLQLDSRDHNEEVSKHLKLLLKVPN